MKLVDIQEGMKISPGEYLFHEPSSQIVICGQLGSEKSRIKTLAHGRIVEDVITNFKKIQLTAEEHQQSRASRCKGCGGI
tara:strand:- start:4556 stop:4795 length:240 start_codon:yes stop_codon:yes gene_type:complete